MNWLNAFCAEAAHKRVEVFKPVRDFFADFGEEARFEANLGETIYSSKIPEDEDIDLYTEYINTVYPNDNIIIVQNRVILNWSPLSSKIVQHPSTSDED